MYQKDRVDLIKQMEARFDAARQRLQTMQRALDDYE